MVSNTEKKMGRPPLPVHLKLKPTSIGLTETELQAATEIAQSLGMRSRRVWLRRTVTNAIRKNLRVLAKRGSSGGGGGE